MKDVFAKVNIGAVTAITLFSASVIFPISQAQADNNSSNTSNPGGGNKCVTCVNEVNGNEVQTMVTMVSDMIDTHDCMIDKNEVAEDVKKSESEVTQIVNANPQTIVREWKKDRTYSTMLPTEDSWWQVFNDTILLRLLSIGESNNMDLRAAMQRIEAARRSLDAIKGGYSPTITLNAGYNKARNSGDTNGLGRATNTSYFDLGLDFNWEIDLFGRIQAQSKQGKAQYLGTKAEYEAAMISMASNIASAYINLRLTQAHIDLALEEIGEQEKLVAITEARYKAGLVSKLDIAQSRTVLYNTQSTLPQLEADEQNAISTLTTLLALPEETVAEIVGTTGKLPVPSNMVGVYCPADMLRRRPDVAQAEYEVMEYAAAAGIASKDWLPTLTLTGSVGVAAHNLKNLFNRNSIEYNIAPELSWTVFDGLVRNNRIAEAKANLEAGIDNYKQVALTATNEVAIAMRNYSATQQEIGLLQKVTEQSTESLDLAVNRYKQGLDAYVNVMNAQESRISARVSELEAKASALDALVKIYTAMGGAPLQSDK